MSTIESNFNEDYKGKISIKWLDVDDKEVVEIDAYDAKADIYLSDSLFKHIEVSKDSSCEWPDTIEVGELNLASTEGKVEIEAGKNCIVKKDSLLWTVTPNEGAEYFTLKIKAKNKEYKKEKMNPDASSSEGDPNATVTIGEPPTP